MRVLHVSQPVTGGVSTVVSDLVRYQTSVGHDVHLATPPGTLPQLVKDAVSWREWTAIRSPGLSVIRETQQLCQIVAEIDPDLVHLHSAKAGLCGRLAIRGRRLTVYQPHGWSFLAVDGIVAQLARSWERLSAQWAHAIVCVSAAEQCIGEDIGVIPTRYEVCPNGIPVEKFGALSQDIAREALGLDKHAMYVLCVGRLTHQKGIDLLLEAWQHVRASQPSAQLLVVGDGPDRESVEHRARSMHGSVVFAGARQDVAAWYAAADVVVLPSRYEGMAMTPLEAMAAGRSVVGFDVCGFKESMGASTGSDVVISCGDTEALAEAIRHRLDDPVLRSQEGERNLRHAQIEHDVLRAAQRLDNVYHRLADQSLKTPAR